MGAGANEHHGRHLSTTSSISGSVLGKRDSGVASESEKEEKDKDDHQPKRRRVAPTLLAPSRAESSNEEAKKQ